MKSTIMDINIKPKEYKMDLFEALKTLNETEEPAEILNDEDPVTEAEETSNK